MIEWPKQLINDIARRRCVLYLGSGVSANSTDENGKHPPTWEEFLTMLLDEIDEGKDYIETLLKQHDFLTACEIIQNTIGIVKFQDHAKTIFLRKKFREADIHKHLFNLDSRITITPNVDKIYDTYASVQSSSTVVIKNQTEKDIVNVIRCHDRLIIKAHGTIDTPADMIFSRYQYNEARQKYRDFYNIIDSLLHTHTFVFIGCGYNDPDIRLVLENHSFMHKNCRPHFFLAQKNSIQKQLIKIMKDNSNLEVLTYDFGENHQNLCESLEELVKLVETERSGIAESQDW